MSIAILGTSPTADLITGDAQSQVDAMLAKPEFVERFSRFVNSKFNVQPGTTQEQDSSYFLTKHILTNNKQWKELFQGGYDVKGDNNGQNVQVTETADGLGYFRSKPWLDRYAGNELTGLKLSTAFRIMNNTVGLQLVASTNAPDADVSATGRAAAPCNQCHFQNWYALDKVADVLTRVKREGNNVTYAEPATKTPITINGKQVNDDKSLVDALVTSEQFSFRACRLSFEYLYGRAENVCEGTVFDKCVDAFKASGNIQSAIATVAKDATFCQ